MIKRSNYRPLFNFLLPLLLWGLIVALPYLFSFGNFKLDAGKPPIQGFLIHEVSLIVIFYVHTYLVYPVSAKKYGVYKYLTIMVTGLAAYIFIKLHYAPPRPPRFINPDFPSPNPVFMALPFITVIGLSIIYRLYLDKTIRENQIKARETLHLKTELELLSAQISPHFMFNLLNTLVFMSRKKPELVEPSLISLSQLMRYMLYDSEEGYISLTEEIEYLKTYMNLQMLRFGEDLNVNLYLSGNLENLRIEPMLLIPFVENAFKHGIGASERPVIDVSLTTNESSGALKLEVINEIALLDAAPAPTTKKRSGIGLANVRRRLELLYPDRHLINITQQDAIFTVNVEIRL